MRFHRQGLRHTLRCIKSAGSHHGMRLVTIGWCFVLSQRSRRAVPVRAEDTTWYVAIIDACEAMVRTLDPLSERCSPQMKGGQYPDTAGFASKTNFLCSPKPTKQKHLDMQRPLCNSIEISHKQRCVQTTLDSLGGSFASIEDAVPVAYCMPCAVDGRQYGLALSTYRGPNWNVR